MASFNRVMLMGNVTRDAEVRYIPSGTAVCDLGVAVNDRKKVNDEWVEEVTFVDVTLWGKTAEVAGQYLKKGAPVFIEGRLKLDTWENSEGEKRSKLKVVCERMQMIGGRRERDEIPEPVNVNFEGETSESVKVNSEGEVIPF